MPISDADKFKMVAPTSRRHLLGMAGATAIAALGIAGPAWAANSRFSMSVGLHNIHTDETVDAMFWDGNNFAGEAISEINWCLRDWRTGEIGTVDARLLVTLYRLAQTVGSPGPFHLISGFRSESTNLMLHGNDPEGVPEQSYHMFGMAMDIRLPGFKTEDLRTAAIGAAFGFGGFGYYPKSDFIHIDTGQTPRVW